MNNRPTISVVIVNYNVKEYLEHALNSIKRALVNISHEIFVVDNASIDGSVEYIRRRFPEVHLIANSENVGFARANNQALKLARGEFIIIINPDTLVQEDTFTTLLDFFKEHPDAAAATCKILNPDGSFSVDCRHAIPTPSIAFWKVTGLSRLFPRSRLFGQYNLTYLDPDETYTVPAISGSFMMIKKEVLDRVGLFDERFFMYCEDIDLCHRINEAGFKIYYVPTTQIIHYKGESTKKNRLDYVITFNKSLYQFFQKYYARSYVFLFRWIIVLGIVLRGIFIFIKNFFQEHFPLIVDVLVLNAVVLLSFVVRMELKDGFYWHNFFVDYWIINVISTLLFLAVAYNLSVYPRHRLSIQAIIKTNVLTFTLLASLTFFLKQFAYSRMVVLIAAVVSPIAMSLWRALLKRYYKGDRSVWGKDLFSKPTVLVGNGPSLATLYRKIQDMRDLSYELVGIVTTDDGNPDELQQNQLPVLGSLNHLDKLIPLYGIRQVIFATDALSYEKILKTMTSIGLPNVEYKMVPSSMEVVIGKAVIERLDDYPLVDIEYAIGKPFNRFLKRLFDVGLAALLLIPTTPIFLPVWLWNRKSRQRVEILGEKGKPFSIYLLNGFNFQHPVNRWLILWQILLGKFSFVGSPIQRYSGTAPLLDYWYKPGITGLVQINQDKISQPDDMEKYHLFYLKNQSILLDIEILLKALFQRRLFVTS